MRAIYGDMEINDYRQRRGSDQRDGHGGRRDQLQRKRSVEGEWIEKGMHLTGVLPYEFDISLIGESIPRSISPGGDFISVMRV